MIIKSCASADKLLRLHYRADKIKSLLITKNLLKYWLNTRRI